MRVLPTLVLMLCAAPAPAGEPKILARWLEVDITAEDAHEPAVGLAGQVCADLYLGFLASPDLIGVVSHEGTGLRLGAGEFYQHPFGNDQPPQGNIGEFVPSALFDTYLTIGETRVLFTPTYGPPMWGQSLVCEWLPFPGETLRHVSYAPIFTDDLSYIRIGRFTVPQDALSLHGQLTVIVIKGTITYEVDVTVPDAFTTVFREVAETHSPDLDNDGVVGHRDLAILLAAWGSLP